MSSAAAASVAWFSALTLIQTRLVAGSTVKSVTQIDPNSFDANFMTYGIILGIVFGGVTAWLLLAPIPSSYRRGALAIVSALAGTTLGMAATLVLDHFVGRGALIGLGMVAVMLALWLGRRAVRSAR